MNNLCWLRNFNTHRYNGSEYVCISWSGASLLGAKQAGGAWEGFIFGGGRDQWQKDNTTLNEV